MKTVFLVEHEYETYREDIGYRDHVKSIGIYATKSEAEAAVKRVIDQPGFKDHPDGFQIVEVRLGHTEWLEGFGDAFSDL